MLFGLARMFETTSEALEGGPPHATHVVRTADEAIAWLQGELPDVDFSEARARLGP